MKGFLVLVGSFNTLIQGLEAQVIISVLRKNQRKVILKRKNGRE